MSAETPMIDVTLAAFLDFVHVKRDPDSRFILIQLTGGGQLISQVFHPAPLGSNPARMVPDGEYGGRIVATSAFRREDLAIAMGFMAKAPEKILVGLAHDGRLLIETDLPAMQVMGIPRTSAGRSPMSIQIPPAAGLVFPQDLRRN